MTELTPFAAYESVKPRLPSCAKRVTPQAIENFFDIIDDFDAFFFDAFGVLNIGPTSIPGAIETIDKLHEMGKYCLVVSNASTYDQTFHVRKFMHMGFHFDDEEIMTSRDAVLAGLVDYPKTMRWGTIGPDIAHTDVREHGFTVIDQEDDEFAHADGFLFFSPLRWNAEKQAEFIAMLRERPRPVLLGNPDLVAPQGKHFSTEAGSYILTLPEDVYQNVTVFGKPFHAIYDIAKARLAALGGSFNPERTLMLGDTLHTDILGGNAYGIKTALVTDHGFFKGEDYMAAITKSGITPDYLLPNI